VDGIRHAYQHREQWRLLGENGRRYVLENFSRQTVCALYDRLFTTMLEDVHR
jgi:hypothetical protein